MKTIDKRFLQVPFLRLAEIVEELEGEKLSVVKKRMDATNNTNKPEPVKHSKSVVPQAIRQMLKEMDHFVYKTPVQKDDFTLENWKASIKVPKLAVSSQQSQSV